MTPIKKKATPKALNSANRCAYCGDSQASPFDIRWNVSTGIAACKQHAEWAKWDCKIYMHKEGLVLLEDALLHPPINSFISSLQGLTKSFGVNGGWRVGRAAGPFFVRMGDTWTIPIYNEGEHMSKRIPVDRFLDEDMIGPILHYLPLMFTTYVQYTLNLLELGIYSDYERVTGSL